MAKALQLLKSHGVTKDQLMVTVHHNRYFFKLPNTKPQQYIFVSPTQDGRTTRPLQYFDVTKASKCFRSRKAPWAKAAKSSSSIPAPRTPEVKKSKH